VPDRERVYRTEAVVLRHSDFGEADRLLTVYTPYRGKLRLLAKGARKPRSRKTGHLDLFTRSHLLIARGRNLDLVTQAETVEPYLPLRSSLELMARGHYIAELVDDFGEEQAENPPLYELLCNALDWICTSPQTSLALRFFELRLLELAGYRPQLFECARCRTALEPVTNHYSDEAGGVVCPRCAPAEREARPLALGAFKVLRYLQTRSHAECLGLHISSSTATEVERLLQGNLTYILERRLKSVEFMNQLRHEAGV
jgi:DNA repair protein RecO (recombination protein O)